MENQDHSSDNSAKGLSSLLSPLINLFLSYYSELISSPFRSGLVYFIAGLVPALIIGWIIFPMVLYSEQQQPVNFNHAMHMDSDIVDGIEGDTDVEKCLYCHSFRDDGTFAGIPRIDKCTECHDDPESPLGESPDEQKFLTEYVAEEIEVP